MNVDPEMLMAYADGELDAVSAKRVEKAIAADPGLAAQVARHRALRDRLRAHFDPVAVEEPPAALAAMIRAQAKVVDIREARAVAPPRRWWRGAGGAGAIAASLALGVVLGQMLLSQGGLRERGGVTVASGAIARALDSQLASAQPAGAPVRVRLSFKAADGSYCRVFEDAGQSGIACRANGLWQIRQLRSAAPGGETEFRQAASSALMTDAQEMMRGEPLDASAEQAAAARGWKD